MSRVPAVENHNPGVRVRFKGGYGVLVEGIEFLTVGFRGPFAASFSRYSYLYYCACVTTPIQMYGAGTLT